MLNNMEFLTVLLSNINFMVLFPVFFLFFLIFVSIIFISNLFVRWIITTFGSIFLIFSIFNNLLYLGKPIEIEKYFLKNMLTNSDSDGIYTVIGYHVEKGNKIYLLLRKDNMLPVYVSVDYSEEMEQKLEEMEQKAKAIDGEMLLNLKRKERHDFPELDKSLEKERTFHYDLRIVPKFPDKVVMDPKNIKKFFVEENAISEHLGEHP